MELIVVEEEPIEVEVVVLTMVEVVCFTEMYTAPTSMMITTITTIPSAIVLEIDLIRPFF